MATVTESSSSYSANPALKDYTGIDSAHSQAFSVAIFFFMVIAMLLFSGIAVAFIRGKTAKALKTGEKWLFAWIFFGVLVSIVFGVVQLFGGYLF